MHSRQTFESNQRIMTDEDIDTGEAIETNIAPLLVKLLYEHEPVLSKDLLTARLQSLDSMFVPFEGDICLYRNERYTVKTDDGDVAIPVLVSPLESLDYQEQIFALRQTWDWENAEMHLNACRHGLVIADVGGAILPAKDRLTLFQTILRAVLELNTPQVVFWTTSQRLLEPVSLARQLADETLPDILKGAVNVRSFRYQQDLSHRILDTMGLTYFGLNDIQCHFHSLEPGQVASILYNLAAYVFDKGNVIGPGHTIDGINGEPWTCQFEWSLVAPRRPVIDLTPGPLKSAKKATPE
jgi:hypothetical protein